MQGRRGERAFGDWPKLLPPGAKDGQIDNCLVYYLEIEMVFPGPQLYFDIIAVVFRSAASTQEIRLTSSKAAIVSGCSTPSIS